MAVNFNLLRREGPMGLYEGLEQGQQAAAQNVLAQQKMAQEQQVNALRAQQAQLGMEKTRAELAGVEEDRVRRRRAERVSMFRDRLLRAATPEAAREIVKMQYADPDLAPVLSQAGTLDQALAEVPDDPAQFQTYRQQEAMGMTEWMKSQLPKTVGNAIYLPAEGRFVTPPAAPKEVPKPADIALMESLGLEPTIENLARLKQAQAAPRAPGAPVAVMGPDGRPVYVTPEQAIGKAPVRPAAGAGAGAGAEPRAKPPTGYRYTSSGDLEPIPGGPAAPELSPKEIQKREAALPQARQAVSTVRNTMSVIKETVDRLLANETGLNGVTGAIAGRTPGITDAARQAEADLEQLQNLAFIQGITELRNASKTGAGVGNVSNKEGDRFENLKASLKRTQSLSSMKSALKRLRDQADFTDTTLQEAFDETYQYRTQREGAGGAGGAGANTVTLPDGRVMTFPNAKAAADFKKAARLP